MNLSQIFSPQTEATLLTQHKAPFWFEHIMPRLLSLGSLLCGLTTVILVLIWQTLTSEEALLFFTRHVFDISLSQEQIPRLLNLWASLRYSVFLYGLLVTVGMVLVKRKILKKPQETYWFARQLLRYLGVIFLVLFICELYVFALPLRRSMGAVYSAMSADPFGFSRRPVDGHRILTPLIAFMLLLQGPLYMILIMIFTAIFVSMIFAYARIYCHYPFRRALMMTIAFSLTTPVIFQFQFPGYVDITSYLLILIFLLWRPLTIGRGLLYLALLLNHEASICFPGLLTLSWIESKSKSMQAMLIELTLQVSAIAIYVSYLQLIGKNSIVQIAYQSSTYSPLTQFITHLHLVVVGVLVAYKLLWVLPVLATVYTWRLSERRWLVPMWAFILGALLQLPIGLDTSRLLGTAYPAFLIAFFLLRNNLTHRFAAILLLFSALPPPFFVSLHSGIYLPQGFHWTIYQIFGKFMPYHLGD